MDESSKQSAPTGNAEDGAISADPVGIHALDLGYSSFKNQLMRTKEAFNPNGNLKCCVCHHSIPDTGATTIMCSSAGCDAVSHLQCLSAAFIREEKTKSDVLVPTNGSCPSCRTQLSWVDLVKELSLRMRGEKEVTTIFKVRRAKKGVPGSAIEADLESSSDDDDPLEMVLNGEHEIEMMNLCDSSDDQVMSTNTRSDPSLVQKAGPSKRPSAYHSDCVIEESDWE